MTEEHVKIWFYYPEQGQGGAFADDYERTFAEQWIAELEADGQCDAVDYTILPIGQCPEWRTPEVES